MSGDYAAENLLKLLGRYDGLALDSWTRAKFFQSQKQRPESERQKDRALLLALQRVARPRALVRRDARLAVATRRMQEQETGAGAALHERFSAPVPSVPASVSCSAANYLLKTKSSPARRAGFHCDEPPSDFTVG